MKKTEFIQILEQERGIKCGLIKVNAGTVGEAPCLFADLFISNNHRTVFFDVLTQQWGEIGYKQGTFKKHAPCNLIVGGKTYVITNDGIEIPK